MGNILEAETLTCPFCGAPYRESIPSGTVHARCKYCKGTIIVPAYFEVEVIRCPNHPDVLAVGLCNDCGGSYCDSCLCFYDVEHGTLYLCPKCFRERETSKATGILVLGVLVLLAGFFFIAFAPSSEGTIAGVFLIGFFALPFVTWGVYKTLYPTQGLSLKERKDTVEREIESRKAFGSQASFYF